MEYTKPSFSVSLGSKDFSENYDRVFRKKGIAEGDASEKAGDMGASIGDMPNAPDLAMVEEDGDEAKLKKIRDLIIRRGVSK